MDIQEWNLPRVSGDGPLISFFTPVHRTSASPRGIAGAPFFPSRKVWMAGFEDEKALPCLGLREMFAGEDSSALIVIMNICVAIVMTFLLSIFPPIVDSIRRLALSFA